MAETRPQAGCQHPACPIRLILRTPQMAWWKRRASSAETSPVAAEIPLISFEGIGKVFEGDADEPAVALCDVTVDIDKGGRADAN
jgi:hypothetical protein